MLGYDLAHERSQVQQHGLRLLDPFVRCLQPVQVWRVLKTVLANFGITPKIQIMPVKFSDLALTPDDATELYRKVGRALWAFTFLEYIIAYRITLILSDSPAIQNDVHSCLQKHFKLTLGALLQKLRETCAIPSDLDLKLSQHHINRNWLYHRLYLEGHPCLYNRQKFQALFIKLDAMKNLAHELTVIFDGLMYQWLILKGISQEVLYQETRRQIDSLKIQHDPFAR